MTNQLPLKLMTTINAPETLDDLELLKLISDERSKLALTEFYDRYRHSLGGFIRQKVYQDKLVDEIYNDVMLTVWQKADQFRSESKVSTWIFGIAYRMCMAQSRKEMKHTENMGEVEFDDMPAKQHEENETEMIDQLRCATSKLGDAHRTVIELTYFQGHSLTEVAEIMRCPVNTVKTRLFHARNNLKNSLLNRKVVNEQF